MHSLHAAIRDLVDRSIESGSSSGHTTVVISAGLGIVQWLAEPRGVFHIEVADPAGPRRRTLVQRLRRHNPTGPAGFTERELALLAELGFVAGEPNYELRPDEAGLDREQIMHIITTVLRDVLQVRDPGGYSADIF
ncbi:hypothetical protein HGA13_10805 [Nocardia speluncae]|uniref:Uncharacterized protein n=1 Tax=Nocardia speluncae TaxID=419477 RepID=A0A846XFR6_9NOCA|nr:hypothetical protein [Nocardia speluncae]NKY33560.1 hypothetical protein [Nocardia speluncae]